MLVFDIKVSIAKHLFQKTSTFNKHCQPYGTATSKTT